MKDMSARSLASLERALGVSFREKPLLRRALAHGSFINEQPGEFFQSNERLEFLGDAVIGTVVADELFRLYPDWPEGALTQSRSALVRTDALAGVAAGLDLGRYLYMGRGEEAGGGRERPSNLAAVLEAVVGAVFVDQGYDASREFVLRVLSAQIADLARNAAAKDPKSALQEAVQARGEAAPSYRTVEVAGSDHSRRFTAEVTVAGNVLGRGAGNRKSQAEQAAAAQALDALERED